MSKTRDAYVLVFRKEDAETAAIASGRQVIAGRILEADGSDAICRMCHKPLTTHNLGRMLPGSVLLCCDDPVCFSSFSVDLV